MIKLFDCFHTFVTTHEFLNSPEAAEATDYMF